MSCRLWKMAGSILEVGCASAMMEGKRQGPALRKVYKKEDSKRRKETIKTARVQLLSICDCCDCLTCPQCREPTASVHTTTATSAYLEDFFTTHFHIQDRSLFPKPLQQGKWAMMKRLFASQGGSVRPRTRCQKLMRKHRGV